MADDCTGAYDCNADEHIHGCYAEKVITPEQLAESNARAKAINDRVSLQPGGGDYEEGWRAN